MKTLKRKTPARQALDVLWLGALLGFIGTLAGFMGGLWWFFDLASHFRFQEALFFLLAMVIFLFGKQKKRAALSAVAMMINLAVILPLYSGVPSPESDGRVYRVLQINLNWTNPTPGKVLAFIGTVKPDFIILEEVTDAWKQRIGALKGEYPFFKIKTRTGNFGIALFSKWEAEDLEVRILGKIRLPTLVARFKIEGVPLTLIGTHPPPPIGGELSAFRNEQLQELSRMASLEKGEVLLIGDLNITSWSPFFWDLLEQGGLRDSRRGFGLQPTWPVGFSLLGIPIDHILASDGLVIHDRFIGPDVGSDHYPVVVDFSFRT